MDEMFIDAPAFQFNRARDLFIGHTSASTSDVLLWTTHHDAGYRP